MRIALYHNLLSGGAKRALCELAMRLARRHQVDVYTLGCSEHEFADVRPFVADHRVFAFEPLKMLQSPFGRLNQVLRRIDLDRLAAVERRIAREIDRGGYDVAFVHPCQFEQSPSLLRFLRTTPSVYYCQEPRRVLYERMPERPYDDEANGRRRLLNALDPLPAVYRRALRRLDRNNTRSAGIVLVNSRFMAETLERLHGVRARVSYLGVDVDRFKPVPRERRHVVLSVGSLTPLKGFDFLVTAMARYGGRNRPALVLASNFQNPPERVYLETLARENGVELVLSGHVTDEDLVALYNEAAVVAYAPVREPFGLVPLEAMSCGAPVVAVAEGGVAESVVDGRTGVLTTRDAGAFAAALERVVRDPGLARRYGASGREHVVAHWTWDRAAEAIEGHLRSASEGAAAVHEASAALAS